MRSPTEPSVIELQAEVRAFSLAATRWTYPPCGCKLPSVRDHEWHHFTTGHYLLSVERFKNKQGKIYRQRKYLRSYPHAVFQGQMVRADV